jgi:hypothetical protein
MRKTTKVLALGTEEWSSSLRHRLPYWLKKDFAGVKDFWHLCGLPQSVLVDVAVFHHSFPQADLRYSAEYVRRRWPDAVIVVIGEQAEHLVDPLYDNRANDAISPKELAWLIETSVEARRQGRMHARPVLGGVRA